MDVLNIFAPVKRDDSITRREIRMYGQYKGIMQPRVLRKMMKFGSLFKIKIHFFYQAKVIY